MCSGMKNLFYREQAALFQNPSEIMQEIGGGHISNLCMQGFMLSVMHASKFDNTN
jgi:hypothetical protein